MAGHWQASVVVLQLVTLFFWYAEGQRHFVMELTDDTIAPAIEKYEVIMVEFYAPWCGHCKRLAPEYERASQILSSEAPHVKLAKIDADKYRKAASKYQIGGYPTLRLYTNGIPTETEYEGRRTAEAIVSYVKTSLIPAVSSLSADSELSGFVKNASNGFPVFIGFGLETSALEDIAGKHKRKARFAVIKDISENVMVDFDFDKTPAVVGLHPELEEQAVFYGPFEGNDLREFVQQHLMPLVSPVNNTETVKRLKEDGRPIAIGIVGSSSDETSQSFIKKLKAAVPANRGFVFAYVEATKWPAFVQPFGIGKASVLPTVVIWNRESQFSSADDGEAFIGIDAEAKLTKFLQDFKQNGLKLRNLIEESFFQQAKEVIFGVPALIIVCSIVILVLVLQGCDWSAFTDHKDEQRERGRRTDLEGDILQDKILGDSLESQYFGRKNEKSD